MDWRADPMMSMTPERTACAMRSGLVHRETPTMGFVVARRIRSKSGRLLPSGVSLEGLMSLAQSSTDPTLRSQRSTNGSAMRTKATLSSMVCPQGPWVSTDIRVAMAQSVPTASRIRASVSSQNRARFSNEPP